MAVTLRVSDLAWLNEPDDTSDQCAHGRVFLRVNDTLYIKPEDGLWTVSAAALFLLRSLECEDTHAETVTDGNYMIPCCGFDVFPWPESKYGVVCGGCPNGLHLDVRRVGRLTQFKTEADLPHQKVPSIDWQEAVHGFAEEVERLYARSPPRQHIEDANEREGWRLFWAEWRTRRARSA